MRDFIKNSKKITLVLLLAMILEILSPFMGMVVEAKNGDQIVDSLEIIGGKKDEYRPGEVIKVKGKWSLPDDRPNFEYKEGDTFSITIPEGLTPAFGKINIGSMGEGKVIGNKVVFTFNENVEQLIDRDGGFNLMFTVDTPREEGEKNLPLDFEDDEGRTILKENIMVNYRIGEVVGTSKENLGKGVMSYTENGIKWYIRVNMSDELRDEGKVTLVDKIVGDNHRIKDGSFEVTHQYISDNTTPNHKANYSNLEIAEDGLQFTMDINIESGIWYTIYYETEYTGDYIVDSENGTLETIKLKNQLSLYTKDHGILHPGNKEENKPIEGDFNLGGWAKGKTWGRASIKKVDSRTGKALEGAKFSYYKLSEPNKKMEVTTDSEGIARLLGDRGDGNLMGAYIIEEIKAPDGYKINQDKITFSTSDGNQDKIIIIENELEPIEIKVKKEWKNFKGESIDPQVDIAVKLLADGKEIRQAVIKKSDKEVTFKNLVKFNKKGDEIKYTVEEIVPEGYEETYSELNDGKITITNIKINEPKGSFTLKKVDLDDQKVTLEGAKFTLASTDEKSEFEPRTLETGENGILEFENLPQGNYTLEETEAPKGYVKSEEVIEIEVKEDGKVEVKESKLFKKIKSFIIKLVEGEEKETFIEFPNGKEKIDIEVEKKWEDNNNQDGKRPESVTIQLLANGAKTDKELTLNEGNNWKSSFDDLAKVNDKGKETKYTVKEVEVDGYESEISGSMESGFTITNSHEPEKITIEGSKTWEDNNNQDGKRPESITIRLLANGNQVDEKEVKGNDWRWKFEGLDKYSDGKEIQYIITEDAVEGYTSEVDGYNIINSYTPGKTSVQVTKVWKDNNNQDGKRPGSITIQLLANGEETDKELTLTEDDKWIGSFADLDKYEGGKEIKYTVKEVAVDGYKSEVSGSSEEGFIVTNTKEEPLIPLEPAKTSVKVEKKWLDEKGLEVKENLQAIEVKLLADGKDYRTITLSEENNWKHKFEDLPVVNDIKDTKEIEYSVVEIDIPEGYKSEVSGSAEEGFIVTNTKEEPLIPLEPAKTSVKVEKKWLDEKGLEVKENLQAIEVRLLADGKDYRTITLSEENNWKHKFEDLPVVNDIKYTKEIEYSVVEIDIPEGYKSEVSGSAEEGFIVTNTKEEPTNPEPTNPEPTDPEPTDPEPMDPEPTDPEPTDPEPTDPEPTDPEPTDPEPTDPEPTDPEPTDPEPTDPEPTDPEPTDPEPTDPEPTDPEPTDPEPTDPEPTDPEPTDPEPTDPEPTDPEPTDPEPTDPEPTDPEPTDPEPTDPEPTEPTEPEKPTVPEKPVVEEPEKPTVPGKPVIEEPEKPTVPEKPVVEEPEKPTVPEEPVIEDPEEPVIGEGEIADENDDSHIMGDSAENEDNNSYIEDKNENHDSSVKGDSMEGDSENNSNSPILPKTGQTGNLVFIIIGLFMVLVGIKLNEEEA